MPIRRNYRGLGRSSSHRQAMLRNMVTSLIQHESVTTTWHKAKEAQSIAEKIITHGKKGTTASLVAVRKVLFEPTHTVEKVFSTLAERYRERPGGYTRVLRVPDRHGDKAPRAVLELVDGERDMRFAMTAKTFARNRRMNTPLTEITKRNIKKVTQFRPHGEEEFQEYAALEARAMEIKEEELKKALANPPKAPKPRSRSRLMENTKQPRALTASSSSSNAAALSIR